MKNTHLLKLSLVASVLAVGAVTLARADNVDDGTYVFTATDGNSVLDGSWVTFSGDAIVSWSLVDTTVTPAAWEPSPTLLPPLTQGNSSVIGLLTYDNGTGPDAFSFSIGSPIGVPSTDASAFWFEGQNNLNGFSALFDGFGNNTFTTPQTDPTGIWTGQTSAVPDASNTFVLIGGALVAVFAFRHAFRGRTLAGC